ncbi:TPA: hypothetical protein HA318_02180 [Candidatus Micrarchaeota archaeon]|nr:MAG: hypothetical protein AUJ65_05710 [Candidatus Micrarchaeota archaeon CG1_02_51_15]HII38786.1 hypothetical protein [Candidatus Micrarchaeota archaeon]
MNNEHLAIAAFCLLAALLATGVMALTVKSMQAVEKKAADITLQDAGSKVRVYGTIVSAYSSNGNFFLKLCDGKCIKIVVFSALAKQMREHSIDPASIKQQSFVYVEGTVQEYQGELEVLPSYYNSIELVH